MAREYLAMAEQLLHPPHPCLWRLEVSRARGSRHSHSVLHPRSAPSRVRSCCAATRRGSVCAVFLSCSASVRKDTRRRCPSACTRTLAEQAALVLRAGHSVVVDAVYARAADRRVIEQVAEAASVPFIGLWLDAPESMLIDRTAQRRNDASDADASVVRMQRAQDTGDIRWCRLDASVPAASVLSSATDRVRERLHDALNVVADEAR